MTDENWENKLKNCFEDLALAEILKKDAVEHFSQFFEFIAEPAFESLRDALRQYRVKAKHRFIKGRAIHFETSFPGTGIDNFHYDILLPKNAVELRLTLRLRGRRSIKSVPEEKEEPF